MKRNSGHLTLLLGVMLLGTAIWLLSAELPLQDVGLAFQSVLPTPRDPHFVPSDSGGWIWCGLQQSSVWLEIPIGFTSEGGAAFYCDPIDPLSQWKGTSGAWEDRGYLIAFYATGVPILEPIDVVFEVDPDQVGMIRSGCFSARYYDAESGHWQKLPTHHDVDGARVHTAFDRFLPSAGYPTYEDRFLIALFVEDRAAPNPTSTRSPTASSSPTGTASPSALPLPSTTPTATWTPASPSPSPPPSTLRSPSPSPAPVASATDKERSPNAMATSTDTSSDGTQSQPLPTKLFVVLCIIIALLALAVVLLLFEKRRKP